MSGFDGNGRRKSFDAVAAAGGETRDPESAGAAGARPSRRRVLRAGAGMAGASLLIPGLGHISRAYAADKPAIGTWPAGSQGDTVHIAAAVPLAGTYAVQAQQTFINQKKIILMTGSTSSAVAVALNKFAQREKIMYMPGISGSNDTTGKDCVRYGFRQGYFGEMAANSIGPILLETFGKNRKMAFMTPDYTYGHTTTESTERFLRDKGGWKTVTNQVSPLGTQDFSQYLTNIANSGAEFLMNVNWGRDAVLSSQQARQFGILPKMTLVLPYQIPFFAKEAGVDISEGVFAATEFWWTLEEKYPLAKLFVESFQKKYGYRPEWGAENAYVSFAHWARMVTEAGSFYPPDVIKQWEKGETIPSLFGDVHYRPQDHQCVRPVFVVRGKAKKDMRNSEDFWEVVDQVKGEDVIQAPDAFGCKLGDYT